MAVEDKRPTLAVWKFASCDGCQLSLLDLEDELLNLAERVQIAYFPEATRTALPGPYDLSLVEGSITTAEDAQRIRDIRRDSRRLVTIGACATSGGIQALRNFGDADAYRELVYPQPEFIDALATSTPIADHVRVDFELRGCPVNKRQLLEVVLAFVERRRPQLQTGSVCDECKASATTCISVAGGVPCLGPVTQSGCGALCPRYRRGCYGCFGPKENANVDSLRRYWRAAGVDQQQAVHLLRNFNAWAPPFREASIAHENENH